MESQAEVLITCSNNCSAYNIENGNVIASYKESNIAPKTLSLIGEDYLIGAIANQPKLRVWTLSKMRTEENGTFTCRGIVTALTVTTCGTYCVGAIEKELHIWQVHSGELLNVASRHYGDVTCLRFSSDDSHVLSGGKDGHVLVWILSQMIGVHIDRDQVKPRFVWSDHASEVTDIFTGSLGPLSRVATTSLDMTCRIYELDSGMLLTTICMDVPLTSVVLDALEYYVFLGANNGSIYKINTYERLPREIHFDESSEAHIKAHEQKVFNLFISFDGTKLLSASEDGTCRLWDIESMAFLRELAHEGNLTNAFLTVKPKSLSKEPILPQFMISVFKKEFDDPMQNGTMKFQTSKLLSKPLSLMYLGSNDEVYSTDILCGSVPVSKEKLSDADRKFYEDICQEALHGGMVHELKTVNNQLYSYLINHGLDNLSLHPSD